MGILLDIEDRLIDQREDVFVEMASTHIIKSYIEKNNLSAVGSWKRLFVQKGKSYIGLEGTICTDPDVVRRFLRYLMDTKNRKNLQLKVSHSLENIFFPMICNKGEYEECYHIDIKSCFYSIYEKVGVDVFCSGEVKNNCLNMDYVAYGVINSRETPELTELEKHKLKRNIMYGITKQSKILRYSGKTKLWTQELNKSREFRNDGLHNFICIFLHSFVNSNRTNIIYWNIDGGFVRDLETVEKMQNELLEIGLKVDYKKITNLKLDGIGIYKSDQKSSLRSGNGSNIDNVLICEKQVYERVINTFKKAGRL